MPDDDEVRRVPALLCITVVAMLPAASARTEPVPETSCAVLPADDAWHLQVGGLPLHPRNDDRRRTSHARRSLVHPGFGPPSYGIPFDVVGAAHDDVSIDVRYEDESDPDPYPFGPDIQVEGGSDRHALMIDRSDCTLYELFAVRWNEGNPTAGSGAVFALEGSRANELRPAGWTSADVAGLAIFPGLLRFDEIEAGVIDHAIRMTVGCTADRYLGRPGTRPTPAPRIARRWARGSGCGEASTCPTSAHERAWSCGPSRPTV